MIPVAAGSGIRGISLIPDFSRSTEFKFSNK